MSAAKLAWWPAGSALFRSRRLLSVSLHKVSPARPLARLLVFSLIRLSYSEGHQRDRILGLSVSVKQHSLLQKM